ncbi:MAG: diguanylate cyclase [Pyrinomonadaceae bacterium]|nr:diguanylate cyclase [Pyrinomonadaceae bacterium]
MKAKVQKQKLGRTVARERGRVLIVTDEPESVDPGPLISAGLEIVAVCRGSAAPVSLQRSRPHLVIASSAIKGISTAELARLLGQTEDGIPLVLVGAKASTLNRRQAALLAGAFDYFQLPAEIDLLVLRVGQVVALRKTMERLRSEADLDHLTGLANRRRFRVALNGELERFRRYSVPCALLQLDIDHMKEINDRFGHPVGDVVIRHVANTLSAVSRDNDTAARLGGEEFALLLANIGEGKATAAAERLRALLDEQSIPGVGSITVSIGVAACPAHATSERALYAASDGALYVAKNEGRNRVAVAPLIQEKLPGV